MQEIEIIEQRKKQEKENELRQDLKIMEEAKRLDEEYVRVKEQEKQKIEEYYRSLMEIIEKRHEHVKSKTQSLETLRTILKNKVDKEKSVLDATDGKLGEYSTFKRKDKDKQNSEGKIKNIDPIKKILGLFERKISSTAANVRL